MSKLDKQKLVEKNGLPWKLAGKFPTFEDADTKRIAMRKNPAVEVKVRFRAADSVYDVLYREVILKEVEKPKKSKKSKPNKKESK